MKSHYFISRLCPICSTKIFLCIIAGIIITGGQGYNPQELKTSEVFHSGDVSTCNIPPLPKGFQRHASAATPNGVVVCGGSTNLYSCYRLSSKNEWVSFPSFNYKRLEFNMFYMNGLLWAIGCCWKSVEYINPAKDSQWTEIEPSPVHFTGSNSCYTELSDNRVIETGGNYGNVSRYRFNKVRIT